MRCAALPNAAPTAVRSGPIAPPFGHAVLAPTIQTRSWDSTRRHSFPLDLVVNRRHALDIARNGPTVVLRRVLVSRSACMTVDQLSHQPLHVVEVGEHPRCDDVVDVIGGPIADAGCIGCEIRDGIAVGTM